MALSLKARKRLSILILVVALPAYIVAAVSLMSLFDRPPILVELGILLVIALPIHRKYFRVRSPRPAMQDSVAGVG